jgi:hypothetical protein
MIRSLFDDEHTHIHKTEVIYKKQYHKQKLSTSSYIHMLEIKNNNTDKKDKTTLEMKDF